MICVTFEYSNKPQYNIQYCNFLKRQALAISKYVLARATLLLHFDTRIMITEDRCHRAKQQESMDLICLIILSEVDHFSSEHLRVK